MDFYGLEIEIGPPSNKYGRNLCEVAGCENEYEFIVGSVFLCKKHMGIAKMVEGALPVSPRIRYY